MRNLLAIVAVFALIYALVWSKKYGYNAVAYLRTFVKRAAVFIMSFSWLAVLAVLIVIACYSNISYLLKEVLSANSVSSIKGVVRLIFGVDSAFMALQMLALYSVMLSFVSCLALSVGLVVRFVYRTVLKVSRATFVEDKDCFESCVQRVKPTFELNLKYIS